MSGWLRWVCLESHCRGPQVPHFFIPKLISCEAGPGCVCSQSVGHQESVPALTLRSTPLMKNN